MMPQLNPDILREIFDEIVESDESFENIDKFMMAGKDTFKLVLDICKKLKDVVICNNKIVVKLPGIHYKRTIDEEDDEKDEFKEPIIGTTISTNFLLFKPISMALVSSLKSLDIRSFAPTLTPMLKSIKREIKEICVPCENLKAICEACANIPKIQNGVTVKVGRKRQAFCDEMKSFRFPCKILTLTEVNFNVICQTVVKNNHLRKNIHKLTIEGNFLKFDDFQDKLKNFAAFISSDFPNLKNLNVNFSSKGVPELWNWNDGSIMADMFRHLRPRIKGCICFKIITYEEYEIDRTKYPDVQECNSKFYKNFSITDTLNFNLALFHNTTISPINDFLEMLNEDAAEIFLLNEIFANNLRIIFEKLNKQHEKSPILKCKNFSIKPKPPIIFKNQRSFKPIRNRFSR